MIATVFKSKKNGLAFMIVSIIWISFAITCIRIDNHILENNLNKIMFK